MANPQSDPRGSWLLAQEFLERGDGAFVDELRRIDDADKLGAFAPRWLADKRPQSRRLLFQYLERPLNAFRHEALVKRLYKLAERAGEDEVLSRFLVAFDRSLRRQRRRRTRYDWNTRETWTEETIRLPQHTTLPKDRKLLNLGRARKRGQMAAEASADSEPRQLFSPRTRTYLRRRVWRYFRQLGKTQPQRYVAAVAEALKLYTDEDVADGLALIDNWGLMHVLFHNSPAVVAKPRGWKLAEGHTLAELTAAPAYESLWTVSAAPLIDLLRMARCRPVRQWSLQMLRRHHPTALHALPLRDLFELLASEDADVAQLAAEALHQSSEVARMPMAEWWRLLDEANPQTLGILCELLTSRVDPRAIDFEQLVRMAASRPLPVARAGLNWLRLRTPSVLEDCQQLLTLCEAECEAVRPEAVRWVFEVLGQSTHFSAEWVLETLDCRHSDVRDAGWSWFQREPRANQDVSIWQRLLETPYDDVRLRLVEQLEDQVERLKSISIHRSQLDPELVRLLWAAVLLNAQRGGRAKPRVVAQIVSRLRRHPHELDQLLPILAIALRSVRGPEWRAGLAGIVALIQHLPELEVEVRAAFPELKLAAYQ